MEIPMLRKSIAATVLAGWAFSAAALAGAPNPEVVAAKEDIQKTLGFVPDFLKRVPDSMLPGAWEEMKTLQASDATALPCKIKELIGVAVSAQVPCTACGYGHQKIARAGGATDQEVGEAVAMASLTRKWSTFFNGIQLDEGKFRAEIGKVIDGAKKAMASGMQPPPPMKVVDAKTAMQDIEQGFGFVPDFIKKYPQASLAGAWREMRDVEMNPTTALSGKYKTLIGIAVAAQIPCRYCLIADTEFAKLEGATEQEISEAVAMGAYVRHWATLLEGLNVDESTYKRDFDRIAKGVAAQAGKKTASANPTKQ
jgi:AhpD family alkylhydroperoxidase